MKEANDLIEIMKKMTNIELHEIRISGIESEAKEPHQPKL